MAPGFFVSFVSFAVLVAMAAFGPTMFWLVVYISVAAVTAAYGFALTARHFWQTPQKYPKGLAPS
ncbi:hypothetical protein PMI18_05142, partial [Pseudomonas sp. GM102]